MFVQVHREDTWEPLEKSDPLGRRFAFKSEFFWIFVKFGESRGRLCLFLSICDRSPDARKKLQIKRRFIWVWGESTAWTKHERSCKIAFPCVSPEPYNFSELSWTSTSPALEPNKCAISILGQWTPRGPPTPPHVLDLCHLFDSPYHEIVYATVNHSSSASSSSRIWRSVGDLSHQYPTR
jgi:hypothetical protein